ncbi:MAG: HindVP family restriction endonuclease [Planctomycetaceae bacterium]|jgi:hypothetical protein|nr:HindVP family restriction endonuclease [Planctomycetaceae bacterium]
MPSLFGIKYTNKNFSQKEAWGKNQFNSTFPVALAAYIESEQLQCVYLTLGEQNQIIHSNISTSELFGLPYNSDELYYNFEGIFTPYEQLIKGNLPRIDLITQSRNTGYCLKGIEIKLTALPDQSTFDLPENQFGTEIVVRRDTIVYLACSIALLYKNNPNDLERLFDNQCNSITDWADAKNVLPFVRKIIDTLDEITLVNITKQESLILQPIWKTVGKSPRLAHHCLDVFVWSNFALIELFIRHERSQSSFTSISRPLRTMIWLYKMLFDFSKTGQFDHQNISDELSYNTKNDKAFAISGVRTLPFMQCSELIKPRIKNSAIKHIILDGGQNYLSPERRFDAIIFNSPDLFD